MSYYPQKNGAIKSVHIGRVLRVAVQGVRVQTGQRHVDMALQRARLRTRLSKRPSGILVERRAGYLPALIKLTGSRAGDALVVLRRHLVISDTSVRRCGIRITTV